MWSCPCWFLPRIRKLSRVAEGALHGPKQDDEGTPYTTYRARVSYAYLPT